MERLFFVPPHFPPSLYFSFLPFFFLSFAFPPSFFCPPLISASPFPLPFFLFSFSYSFPIPFSFTSSCFLFFFPFQLLFFLSFYSVTCISNRFTHVQVRKSLNKKCVKHNFSWPVLTKTLKNCCQNYQFYCFFPTLGHVVMSCKLHSQLHKYGSSFSPRPTEVRFSVYPSKLL